MFEDFMMFIYNILGFLASNPLYIYGIPLAAIIITVTLRGVQFRYLKTGTKMLVSSGSDSEGISSFKAAALAIGGRVGTGNIAGVTVAILVGGPGAIFWMWMTAIVSMATSFAESSLSQVYKVRGDDHVYVGGPSYYLNQGMKKGFKWLGSAYALIMIFSFGLFFIALQTSTIYSASFSQLPEGTMGTIGKYVLMGLMIIGVAYASFGGMSKLTNLSAYIVPPMTIGYTLLVLCIVLANLSFVPTFFYIVVSQAFTPIALVAGGLGTAIASGVKRGIFSNEAGQGSGAIASASASVSHPVEQGFAQMVTVVIDTLIVCTSTAFVIILSWHNADAFNSMTQSGYDALLATKDGALLATNAFESVVTFKFIFSGGTWLAIFLFFFAFSSILAEIAYGMQSVKYLVRNHNKKIKNIWLKVYSTVTVLMVLLTPMFDRFNQAHDRFSLFDLADNMASLLFYTNVIALLVMLPILKKILKDYEQQKATNQDISFDPKTIGLDTLNLREDSPWLNK